MRLERWGAAALILATLLAVTPAARATVDPFRLDGLDGGSLDERRLNRGPVIVVVWASWSPRCRDIVERVNDLADRWGDRADVLTVNFQEDPAAVRAFLTGHQLKAPVFLDAGNADFSKQFAVTRVPRLLVFKQGATALNVNLPQDADEILRQVLEN